MTQPSQPPGPTDFSTMSATDIRTAALNFHRDGSLEQAQSAYQYYLNRAPYDGMMWSNLGALFRKQKDFELASVAARRALAYAPDEETVLNNAANAFFDAGTVEEALELRRKVLAKKPDSPEHMATLGKYLRALGRHQEAVDSLTAAIETHPTNAELHIQLAMAQLSLGDYAQGFEIFDWRWQGDEISPPDFGIPKWSGEDLTGKTIIISPEQGFGDTVLIARFLRQLSDKGATVLLLCKPPLQRLFSGVAGVTKFASTKSEIAACDFWAPMMDLPRYLGLTLDTIPAPAKLTIPASSVKRAKEIVAPFKQDFKLGVMWSGSVTYRANHKRSFGHRQFLYFSDIPNLQMFSFYKGPLLDSFLTDGTSSIIVDAAGDDKDFADSAGLLSEMDLLITMDSAIAHVAGSLGVPVWNLLHSEAYWLYEPFDKHTPWYPSMRLFRQRQSGEWDNLFAIVKADLIEQMRHR